MVLVLLSLTAKTKSCAGCHGISSEFLMLAVAAARLPTHFKRSKPKDRTQPGAERPIVKASAQSLKHFATCFAQEHERTRCQRLSMNSSKLDSTSEAFTAYDFISRELYALTATRSILQYSLELKITLKIIRTALMLMKLTALSTNHCSRHWRALPQCCHGCGLHPRAQAVRLKRKCWERREAQGLFLD